MITDPLFIVGISGMLLCLIAWIRFNIDDQKSEPFFIKYLSTISFISAIALLLSIFYNSGGPRNSLIGWLYYCFCCYDFRILFKKC